MTTTYFNSVTSKAAYEKRRRDAEPTSSSSSSSFTHSLQSLARVSTSKWSTRQLIACRVYVTTHKDINTLPIFPDRKPPLDLTQILRKRNHAGRPKATNSACTAASDSDSCWERVLFQLVKLCQGPQDTTTLSEHRRLWNDDDSVSHIWAALDCLRPETGVTRASPDHYDLSFPPPSSPSPAPTPNLLSSPPAAWQPRSVASSRPHPPTTPGPRRKSGRVSNPPSRPSFISSLNDILSSSPTSNSVNSAPQSNYNGDQEASAQDKRYPEVLTVRFMSAFIRNALPWLPSQSDPKAVTFVTFDDCPAWRRTFQFGTYAFTSQHDGGLAITTAGDPPGRVAILEAKRTMGQSVDGIRLVSDYCLGQVVREALAIANPAFRSSIMVILAARYNIRFLQVDISQAYVEQLRAHSRDDKAPFTEYICVKATQWFDLRKADDRCETILNFADIVCLAHNINNNTAKSN
ncbi:hypothetical protein LZ32DRAFT_651894 [Colletotrichum eremochloae]|nr:hypothetical protein LZ32DRAFT_651894 [Colletotrichum eremochloae]